MAQVKEKTSYFRMDWHELREFLRSAIKGETPGVKNSTHRTRILGWLDGSSWQGYTRNQILEWLDKGFKTNVFSGLEDLVPPIRDKRKLIFSEEGDEYHHDMMLSGDDNYMSSWTHRDSIPGVSLNAGIMFSSAVDAKVINPYISWICRMAYSLEMAGIDTEITLDFPSFDMDDKKPGVTCHNLIRVKSENELTDYHDWSPMLSPAAFRCFGFIMGALHCERDNGKLDYGWGRGMPNRREWKVSYDPDRRTIEIVNPYSTSKFDEESMTRQFRAALEEMQGKHLK